MEKPPATGNRRPLLEPGVPITISEMLLDVRKGVTYGFATDMGRMAAAGKLIAGLHPRQLAFAGEQFILTDWGLLLDVELKAESFISWLTEMQANWGDAFVAFIAGFLQGIRAAAATAHPELGHELVAVIGGRLSRDEAEWPLRDGFATALEGVQVRVRSGLGAPAADLRVLKDAILDADENAAVSMLAQALGTHLQRMMSGSVPLRCDFQALSAATQAAGSPQNQRSLWLLVFMLTHLGKLACDSADLPSGASLFQAGHLALQRGAEAPEYFESALACCIHRESKGLRIPSVRRVQNDVFSLLAYANSRAVTCLQMFQASQRRFDKGLAKNAMWTGIWGALNRLRACETAFAAWAGNDLSVYAQAAPGLLALSRTHLAAGSILAQALQWAVSKSMPMPWVPTLTTLLPKLQQEFEWCRSVVETNVGSPSAPKHLMDRFVAASSVMPHGRPGINAISFVPAAP